MLTFLLNKEAPERISEINNLYVVARCGCGKCPTVMFGDNKNDIPFCEKEIKSSYLIADYVGKNKSGTLVGVQLEEYNGKIANLEAWSVDGGEVASWPHIYDLKPLSSTDAKD